MQEEILTLTTHSPHETEVLGENLGQLLKGGEVIGLMGDMGCGKTCFIKGLAKGVGADPKEVSSPTFTLQHSYSGKFCLHHWDLYRLQQVEEAEELDILDQFDDPNASVVIEWAEKAKELLPKQHLSINIQYVDEHTRYFELRGKGKHYQGLLNQLPSLLSQSPLKP